MTAGSTIRWSGDRLGLIPVNRLNRLTDVA